MVLTGTKSFNTNSGGHGLANVGYMPEGSPGRYHVLVELRGCGPAVMPAGRGQSEGRECCQTSPNPVSLGCPPRAVWNRRPPGLAP